MKFRYYLRGAGLGIIVVTIILTIAFSNHKPIMTDEEIIAAAEELGMVKQESATGNAVAENLEGSDTKNQVDDIDSQDNLNNQDNTNEDNGDTQSQDGTSTEPGDTESDVSDAEGTAVGEDTDAAVDDPARDYVTIYIKSGDTSEVVSEKLVVAGIIEDANDFNLWIVGAGKAHTIFTGYYDIPMNATYDEIANIITNKR